MEGYFPGVEGLLGGRGGTAACEAAEGVTERGVLAEAVMARFGSGSGYCGTSFGVLQCVDPYLASLPANVSVIHFNWGLHDICEDIYHVRPSLDEHAGPRQTIPSAAAVASIPAQVRAEPRGALPQAEGRLVGERHDDLRDDDARAAVVPTPRANRLSPEW